MSLLRGKGAEGTRVAEEGTSAYFTENGPETGEDDDGGETDAAVPVDVLVDCS